MPRKAPKVRCTAHRRDAKPCTAWACHGQKVCGAHGGKSPQAKAAAARRLLDQAAAAELAKLKAPPADHPLEELMLLAEQAIMWKNMMAQKVSELTSLRYESATGQEQLRSELGLWERSLDRCAVLLTALVKLDVDRRLAAIAEEEGALIADVVRSALAKTGATPEQQAEAKRHIITGFRTGGRFRALPPGSPSLN